MKRIVAIHKEYGIYITTINNVAFFSNKELVGFTKCQSFENETEAINFFTLYMPDYVSDFTFRVVESLTDKPSVIELIKSGCSEENTSGMFFNLPVETNYVH